MGVFTIYVEGRCKEKRYSCRKKENQNCTSMSWISEVNWLEEINAKREQEHDGGKIDALHNEEKRMNKEFDKIFNIMIDI